MAWDSQSLVTCCHPSTSQFWKAPSNNNAKIVVSPSSDFMSVST